MKSHWLWAILMVLGGCGAWQSKPPSAPVPASHSKYQFDYQVTNGEPIALVRVFDDGGSTYFQFRHGPPEPLVISSETSTGEAIIPHEVMGNYAVIRGVYRASSIPAAAMAVTIQKLGAIAPMASMGPVILPRADKESAARVDLDPLPVLANNPASDLGNIRQIRFRRNSALLSPMGRMALAGMVSETANTGDVAIRVRPFYPNRRISVRLAEARAKVIRQSLIDSGVAESRIRVSSGVGIPALMAEVEFHAPPSQAIRDAAPIRTSFEREHMPVDGVKSIPPSAPILSTHN